MNPPPELLVVAPVYNEQASLRHVVMEWFQEIETWTERFVFVAIDDGSSDRSLEILQRLRQQLGERLEIITRPNRGHGQSCIEGYRLAVERQIPFIFQIDSDGQCDPQYFFRFWRQREKYDVIYGERVWRDDGWRRILASEVLKATLLFFAGTYCRDANVPYRLMRTETVKKVFGQIPSDFFLVNVGLAVLLRREKEIRDGYIKIRFRERYGGEPTVKISKFGEKAFELIRQLRSLKRSAN
jgi:glycosyltransferase involved in cell wall biosynthesis